MSDDAFARLADPYRRELLAYCYRMLGSFHDAEDLVQETYLRAWRAREDFDENRASLRTWLYRIATNACLSALAGRQRRVWASEWIADPPDELTLRPEIPWLQPFPPDPAALAESRDSIRLAFVAALQHLPARQRAVLILRDVLAWRAAEVASLLGTTPAGVNSALQRARSQLSEVSRAEVAEPPEAERRAVLDRYVTAFVDADLDALTELLTDDIVLEMPPYGNWYRGAGTIRRFLEPRMLPGRWRMVPVTINGELGVAGYIRRDDGVHHAHSLQTFTLTKAGISWLVAFVEPELFPRFGLPPTVS